MIRIGMVIASLLCLLGAGAASAATLQPIGSFEEPIYVTSDPGNPERLFVVERAGRIEQVQGGTVTTFADLRSLVSTEVEDGLLSIALAPDFDSSGRLYVDYTGKAEPGEIHVAEMHVEGATAPISTLRDLLTIPHPNHKNHNGGQLQFGPEGMLFVSTGDGGGNNDVEQNAQDLESLLGKILRITPTGGIPPYTVPAGNPFPLAAPPYNTIWSYGLRNPFRFSFDRLTGDLLIADVGEGAREEVDLAAFPGLGAGADYGWNCREGTIAGPATDPECATPPAGGFVEPIFDYSHEGNRCAIIGGYVSRASNLTGLFGHYIYGDLCSGEIRAFEPAAPRTSDCSLGLTVTNLNSFGEDSAGRLYAVSGDGPVYMLTGAAPSECLPSVASPLAGSFIGIKAHGRRVRRGNRALITAWVSPCKGRKGEPVKLFEGRRHIASRHLDRACTARFRPKIRHRTRFRAYIGEDEGYVAAISRRLKIRIDHRRHARRPGRTG